jgi:hypothetical protein
MVSFTNMLSSESRCLIHWDQWPVAAGIVGMLGRECLGKRTSLVENVNLCLMRVRNPVPVMVLPLYSMTYIYTIYSQHNVATISWCTTQSLGHTCKLRRGPWHWFIYPIPRPESKLLQCVCDIDWFIWIAYIAQLSVKQTHLLQLSSDMVTLTRLLWQVTLTRLLWQVALTGCSDRLFWQVLPTQTSTSTNCV